MTTPQEQYEALLQQAAEDEDVLAFWLGGSRAAGLETRHSDYDCGLIVRPEALPRYRGLVRPPGNGLDLMLMTLTQFEALAGWGGPQAWMRYAFAHLTPLVDRTGRMPALFAEKGQVPAGAVDGFVAASLDHSTNQLYRALKCLRDGDLAAARLESAEAPRPLLDALFAVNGGRLRPYPKYLRWELETYPLEACPWPTGELPDRMADLAGSADAGLCRSVFRAAEPFFRAKGFGAVFDAWGAALPFLRQS